MGKANVQKDLEGAFVVQRKEEKVYAVYRVGGWQARIPMSSHEDVGERIELMQEATAATGSHKFTPNDIDDWKKGWVHNKIKAVMGKRHTTKDFETLYKALYGEVMEGEPSKLEVSKVVIEHINWATNKCLISTSTKGFEGKQKRWEKRLVPSQGKKKRKKALDPEEEARAVAGERLSWVQHIIRLQRGETIDPKDDGTWEAHTMRMYNAIFLGEGLRSEKGESIKPFTTLEEKDRPGLKGTVLDGYDEKEKPKEKKEE